MRYAQIEPYGGLRKISEKVYQSIAMLLCAIVFNLLANVFQTIEIS